MIQVRKTIYGFLLGIGIYAAMIELVGIFFSEDLTSYTIGLFFGVVVAILLLFHITHTLNKGLDMPEHQATKYIRRQVFLRLAFMLVAMVTALLVPRIHFLAAILGMLGLKIGSFIAAPLLKRMYPEDFVTKPEDVYME